MQRQKEEYEMAIRTIENLTEKFETAMKVGPVGFIGLIITVFMQKFMQNHQ